jgi:hypothetical protein
VLNRIKEKPALAILLTIFLLGAFLRAYHFGDWLHFELDQSRDYKIIDLAIKEGPANLPLLGPKAAGTFLRLGPAFYYFGYLSALVFGNTPEGAAVFVSLLGILSILPAYLLFKRYFDEKISLSLVFLFSVSLYLVMYSRFSWNPNPLPFFALLTFYALLRSVDREERRKGLWLLVCSLALGLATQMHFLAFVAIPAIVFLFLVYKRPRINWKYWVGSILIISFLYLPAIINDLETGGDNIGQFLKVAEGKSAKSDHDLIEKTIKSYNENSLGYATVLFGVENRDLPRVVFEKERLFSFICDNSCKNELAMGIFSLLFFTLGAVLLIISIKKEKDRKKRDFLVLAAIWFFVVLGLYIPISYDISPRFFLLVAVIPFIWLGLVFRFLETTIKNKRISVAVIFLLVLVIAGSNLQKIKQRFWQLENAPKESFKVETDKILKEKTRVTLVQQREIISYILDIQKNNSYPVYLNSDPEYRRSFLFFLDQNNIPRDDFRNATNAGKVYEHGNYFLIYPTLSNWQKDLDKYLPNFNLVSRKAFGTLTLFELSPKPEAINALEQDFTPQKSSGSSGVPMRYKWEEIFNDSNSDENDISN